MKIFYAYFFISLLFLNISCKKSASNSTAIVNSNKTILGVYVGNNATDVADFETWLGQPVDAVLGYTSSTSWTSPNPSWQINLPQFLGGSHRQILWSIPMTPDSNGAAGLREAGTGSHNADYKNWAQSILASRQNDNNPIYIRTTWELGGEWFAWTAAAKADPAAYIAAFHQYAQSYYSVSKRFKMVWDFTGDRGAVEQWYPGDDVVDVISQDVYWQPQYMGSDPQVAFSKIVDSSGTNGFARGLAWMTDFASKHNKPMAISEWGVPGSKANTLDGSTFISLMKHWIETHNVVYASYWNSEAAYDGKLSDNDPPVTAATLKSFYLTRTSSPVK